MMESSHVDAMVKDDDAVVVVVQWRSNFWVKTAINYSEMVKTLRWA
jgi:hypothetical protein